MGEIEIVFVGTESGLESEMVPQMGYTLETIDARGLPRRFSIDLLKTPFSLGKGAFDSLKILREFRPHVVVGMGGYVSVPVVGVAAFLKIPTVIHEQNVIPGLANRLLSRVAIVIAISYADTEEFFPKRKGIILTGNPIRGEILKPTHEDGILALGLDPGRKTLLIFGGSRGARRINHAVVEAYPLFRNFHDLQIVHATGMIDFENVSYAIKNIEKPQDKLIYKCFPYLDKINLAYAVADLALCRAGATTIAEITARGIPALLIPYPYATDDHQRKNAKILEKYGAARAIPDEDLNGKTLFEQVTKLIFDQKSLSSMRENSRNLGKPQASRELANLILNLVKKQ